MPLPFYSHSLAYLCGVAVCAATAVAQQALDPVPLEAALGKKALRLQSEGVVHFYGWRRNVPIVWRERAVEVFEGISLRTSFQATKAGCLVAGNWLVFADEALPVVQALSKNGFRVASVLPRFPGAVPQPFELRFFGEGDAVELASGVALAQSALQAVRDSVPQPMATVPLRNGKGPSAIAEAPLEAMLGRKAEVKDGVALFRFPGARGLAGAPSSARMGTGMQVAFVGVAEDAHARLDLTIDRSLLPAVLTLVGGRGYLLEALTAAAPGIDEELVHLELVGQGSVMMLAEAVVELRKRADASEALALAVAGAFMPPQAPELLGLAQGQLGKSWRSDATQAAGSRRARFGMQCENGEAHVTLLELGDWNDRSFTLLWDEAVRFGNGRLTARMHADHGRIDQGGGIAWRIQDHDNYYLTRFNPLEQDFRVYRVVKGVREQLQALGELSYRGQDWFAIEVEHDGDRIRCRLNGRETLEVVDRTFAEAGGVGLWSKADSQWSCSGLWQSELPSKPK
jgi:Domain of Unknown Function (DUF1259)